MLLSRDGVILALLVNLEVVVGVANCSLIGLLMKLEKTYRFLQLLGSITNLFSFLK
jgi:hypothetical protein